MRKLLLTAITLLLLPSFSQAQADNAQLTGSVAYRERITLPADAVIDVQLIDASVADIAAQTVAEGLINAEGRQVPVPFTLTYDPAKIVPGNRYSVRATIRSGDGMLMFSTTQTYPVLTHGASSKVNLLLHTVGHGAKPTGLAKKQATPATSEGSAAVTAEAATPPTSPQTAAASEASTATAAPTSHEADKAAAQEEPPPPATAASSTHAAPETSATTTAAPLPDDKGVSSASAALKPEPAPEAKSSASEAPSPITPSAAPSPVTTSEPPPEPAARSSAPADTIAPPASTEPAPSDKPSNTPDETAPTPPATELPQPTPPAKAAEQKAPLPKAPSPEAPLPDSPLPKAPSPEAASPEAPLPEAPSASQRPDSEAPLPDSPSTSKQAELGANAPGERDEGTAPDEMPARPEKADTPLADTQWKLVQLGGLPVVIPPMQKPVTLSFSPEGRRIAGSGGCNSYLGTFTDDHGRLQLRPGTMTMMACADPAGGREKRFVAMLRSADGYRISGDFLVLTSNGKTVAKFRNNQE